MGTPHNTLHVPWEMSGEAVLPEGKGSYPLRMTVQSARHVVDGILYGNWVTVNSNGQLSIMTVIDSNRKTRRDVMKLTPHPYQYVGQPQPLEWCASIAVSYSKLRQCAVWLHFCWFWNNKQCVTVHLVLRPVAVLDSKFVTVMMTSQASWQPALAIKQQQRGLSCSALFWWRTGMWWRCGTCYKQ